jgi:glutathione S-transferase
MKLYYHPVSTTCRPIMMLAADDNIQLDYQVVDLFTGEHMQEPYGAINPNRQIPVLEDGDFRLTESSTIPSTWPTRPARRLSEGSPGAPASASGWIGSTPAAIAISVTVSSSATFRITSARPTDHAATIEWGRDRACGWLQLDTAIIGSNKFLCGRLRSPITGGRC